MPVESADDLAGFFDPDEFGAMAACEGLRFQGIPTRQHDEKRPGGTTNSSMGSFMVGAADVNMTAIMFLAPLPLPATVAVEETLTIEDGVYAGDYRIKDIQRDGDVARLMLNKR